MHEGTSMWGFLPACKLHEGRNSVAFAGIPPVPAVAWLSVGAQYTLIKYMNDQGKESELGRVQSTLCTLCS